MDSITQAFCDTVQDGVLSRTGATCKAKLRDYEAKYIVVGK